MSEIESLMLSLVPMEAEASLPAQDTSDPSLAPSAAVSAGAVPALADQWPTPPVGQFAAEIPYEGGIPCEVEGLNGRIMRVALQRFDFAAGQVDVISAGLRAPMHLRFAQFRRLTLVPLLGIRGTPQADISQSFKLKSRGGTDRSGMTIGFVPTEQGVYLFEPADDAGAVRRSFIPATAYESLRIGDTTLLGKLPPPAPKPTVSLSGLGPLTEPGALGAPCAPATVPQPFLGSPAAATTGTAAAQVRASAAPMAAPGSALPAPPFNVAPEVPAQQAAQPKAAAADFEMFKLDLQPSHPAGPLGSASKAPASTGSPAPTQGTTKSPSLVDNSISLTAHAAQASPAGQPAGAGAGAAKTAVLATNGTTAATPAAAVVARAETSAAEWLGSKPVSNPQELLAALDRQASMPMVRMGEALMGLGLIDEKQLEQALVIQRGDRASPLGEILVRQGHIQRQDLQMALIRKMGYPLVDAENFQPEFEALSKVPYAMAARLHVLPLLHQAGRLIVAMEDPTRGKVLDELEFATALKVAPTLVSTGKIMAALESAYRRITGDAQGMRNGENELETLDSAELLASLELEGADGHHGEDDRGIEQSDNSLVRLINQMILEAQNQGASDIHIETLPGKERLRIRFRRDGVLRPYMELPHTYRSALIARIKIMCDLDISEKRKPQDGKISFSKFHPGSRLELRVATIPTAGGLEDAVMRLLASAKTLPLDDVGLAPRPLALLKSIVERPYGMFLCVGPTGSGKTTTLHSALGYINRPDRKIWTAEDPVEITQPGLRQVQVNPKIDWTFAKALRAFLRADPDVIMVGEIRDKETATVAVESSLTGHLVMSTLHTNSAPETVTRLLDMGMDPFNFADALLGVLAQRLVRRICSNCKTSREATQAEIDELLADYLNAYGNSENRPSEFDVLAGWQQRFGTDGRLMHHHGAGCDKCGGTGLRGRVGIHELMTVSRDVRRLIQTGARVDELQKQAMTEGMLTLRQDGIEKVLQGFTLLGEVRSSSN